MTKSIATAACAVGLSLAAAAGAESLLYTNAKLVAIDAAGRRVSVVSNDGAPRTLALAAGVTAPSGARRGDRVILALRQTAHGSTVVRIILGATGQPQPARVVAEASAAPTPAEPPDPALVRFEKTVAALSRRADIVDGIWTGFSRDCGASTGARHDREWFALWEGAVRADLSPAPCQLLQDEIVAQGEGVKQAMAQAEETARRAALLPGSIRAVRQRYAMDWDGWTLPEPAAARP